MWILLSITRRLCWRIWFWFTIPIGLLVFTQTIVGRLGEATGICWLWTVVCLLPGLLLLFTSLLTNKHPARLIPKGAHWALWGTTLVYMFLVLLTLLAEPFAIAEKTSIADYRMQSLLWLLPVQLLLLSGYFLTMFRKNPIFNPVQENIIQTAHSLAARPVKRKSPVRQKCFQLIAEGETGQAVEELKKHLQATGTGDINQLLLLENQHNEALKNIDLNLVGYDEGQRALNKINMALMNMLEQV